MPFCKFGNSNNSGSCSGVLSYLEKEDKDREKEDVALGFFTSEKSGMSKDEAKSEVEHKNYNRKFREKDDRFCTVVMAFSEKEGKGKSDKELIDFAQKNFAEMYVSGVVDGKVDSSTIKWTAKLQVVKRKKVKIVTFILLLLVLLLKGNGYQRSLTTSKKERKKEESPGDMTTQNSNWNVNTNLTKRSHTLGIMKTV
jgi:hypothetical protein